MKKMNPAFYISKITGTKMVRTSLLSDPAEGAAGSQDIKNMVLTHYKNSLNKDLLESCKSGDPAAQLKIYKLFYKVLFNISFNIVKDRELAENIMQEAFLTAFEKIHSFSGRASLIKWLVMMVQDMSVESWRKKNIIMSEQMA